jgi:rRNA-processing protein EBP2
MFDIGVDSAPNKSKSGRERGGQPGAKRQKKDSKFGYGGKKRFSKSGDAESSADMRGFSSSRMKGKGGGAKKRPGKSRRAAGK